jgi:hypothetical protein
MHGSPADSVIAKAAPTMPKHSHLAWISLLAIWASAWFAEPADAQTLRLRQTGSNATRIAVQVGQVINIEVYADLQGVSSAGIEFFLTVPDAFQVNDLGFPGQTGTQPFRVDQTTSLFRGAQTPSNLLLPESDPVASTLPGQQMDFSAVLGLGSDRNRTGAGVVATFQLVAVRPIENGVLRIDDNAVRETKLVLTNGVDERRFVTTQGMEITVNGMELLDIPDVILQPGQSDSIQIGRLDNYITNTLSPADSIRWSFESDDILDSVDVSIDPVTRLVRVIPVDDWRGSVRIIWTATDPRRPSPGQPLLSATEVSTIIVNNRPVFDIEPDPDGIKRIRIRLVEDRNTFDPGIPTPDPRRAARFMDLDNLVIDPDVTNPDLEFNYAALPLPQGRPVGEVNVRGSDDESNHTLLAWSRPDFGGTDSIGVRVSGVDTSIVYGGLDSFRVIVRDPFQGRDTLRVIAEVEEVPDAPRIVENETQPRVSRGSTKRYLFSDFAQDPDTPLDALVLSWVNDPSGNFTMDTTRTTAGELVLEVRSSPSFVGTGPIVVTVSDPVDPTLSATETFFFTAAESLPPDVFPDNIKVPVEPGGTWNASLDAFVSDPDNSDAELRWSLPITRNAQIGIDAQRNVTVAAPLEFHGYEPVELTVTDPDNQSATLLLRIYSSDGRPVTGGIPDILLDRGDQNRQYDLDDYYHDSNNTDAQMVWAVLPGFDEESLSVSVDALTHIVTFAASPNATFGTETVILRVTDSQGVSHQDTVLVTIQSGGVGSGGAFQLQPLPPLQAPVGQVVEVIANLHDYVVTSPDVSRSSIQWALESPGNVGFAGTRRQVDATRPDGFRWPLTAFGDVSGVDTLRLVATDSLGRSDVATTTIRYFGESEILELRSIPDIVFIAGDVYEGLTLNDFILDPVAHPDSLISWSFQDIGPTDSGIIPRINDDSTVRVIGFDIAETQVVFIARNDSLGVTGRDTVRVIAQDPSLAARELDPLPPLVIQAGSVDSTIVLNDFLPVDLEAAQTNWSVSGATITNPVIDPTTPHRLRVSSIGTSVGSDTLTFNVRLGGGFRATGEMVVTVVEPVDESTLSLRVVPNPLNANFLDFFVMARTELASSPTVTVNFEGDTTIAVRQIEEDLSARGVLIWAGSYHVRFRASGTVRFGASAITALGTSVNAQTTVALGTATAGKALVLRHGEVRVTAPPDAVRDGQRVYLQSAAPASASGAGRRVADESSELLLVREVSLWPGDLELRQPATVQHSDLEQPGAALYRADVGGWQWLGADRTGSVTVSRFGRLAVLVDARAPRLAVEDYGGGSLAIVATDAGSGLDESSVAVLVAGVRHMAERDATGWKVRLGAPPENAGSQDVVVVARDRAGNEGRHRLLVDVPALPAEARLGANYPNPFNPETVIPLQLPASLDGVVRLRIYNAAGQMVRELLNGSVDPGWFAVTWDGRDGAGRPVGSGTYFYRLEGPGLLHTRSMTLLK